MMKTASKRNNTIGIKDEKMNYERKTNEKPITNLCRM